MMKMQYLNLMSLPPKKKRLRNRRFPLPKNMIPIRIMKRIIWILPLILSLSNKAIRRDQDGFMTPSNMLLVTLLLEELSGKVKDPRDTLGTPP